ncbi:hypothetical protein DPMN_026939 [Dreissena polymorpha]|uniref:Uncharacterized protein n=1 Tax=Dreissena polymorpha TaxID=45954 RepID=A0A9D4LS03_DREPO|nr:hypothetical protein DPMN_026939 [Dreissena polymorpha]
MNLLTKFHEDWTINVASRSNNAPSLGSHCHEDRKINVASRVLTRKNAPPPGGHDFQPTGIIFELFQDIIGMNLLTKKMPRSLDAMFFKQRLPFLNSSNFTCFQYILIEGTALPPGGHFFSPIWTIFELVRDINETNVLTKFRDDWAKIVTSRVFTRVLYSHIMNTAPPPDGHFHEDWASNVTSTVFTIFELSRGIDGTNVLTNFYEHRTINVASGVFTRQNVDGRLTTDDGQKAITKAHHGQVVLR